MTADASLPPVDRTNEGRAGEYARWIAVNVDEPRNKCRPWAHAMASFFPELRTERGWYVFGSDRIEHWWCVTNEGAVVDPTAAQFPQGGVYEPVTDESQVPSGICMACGDYVYEGRTCCSERCEEEVRREYAKPVAW